MARGEGNAPILHPHRVRERQHFTKHHVLPSVELSGGFGGLQRVRSGRSSANYGSNVSNEKARAEFRNDRSIVELFELSSAIFAGHIQQDLLAARVLHTESDSHGAGFTVSEHTQSSSGTGSNLVQELCNIVSFAGNDNPASGHCSRAERARGGKCHAQALGDTRQALRAANRGPEPTQIVPSYAGRLQR